jgi:beta-lactamase superfamily II metal-dependent hydrolase
VGFDSRAKTEPRIAVLNMNTLAECYFLDVGQGSAHVILLENGDVIVIDSGNREGGSVVCSLLNKRLQPHSRIKAFILTHSHADHSSGADEILEAYAERIDAIYFVKDIPAAKLRVFRILKDLMVRGRYAGSVARLEVNFPGYIQLYPSVNFLEDLPRGSKKSLSLILLAPSFYDDLSSDENPPKHKPNRIAAILMLECGNGRIVFAGDAPIQAWRNLLLKTKTLMLCDVLSAPHHGGALSAKVDSLVQDHSWIYANAMKPSQIIFSVGTDNQYQHPSLEAITAARQVNAVVLCTQLTPKCVSNPESIRPGVLPLDQPCISNALAQFSKLGRSQNVACAGTVMCSIGVDCVVVDRLNEHQKAIDALHEKLRKTDCSPLCRRSL